MEEPAAGTPGVTSEEGTFPLRPSLNISPQGDRKETVDKTRLEAPHRTPSPGFSRLSGHPREEEWRNHTAQGPECHGPRAERTQGKTG